MKLTALCLVSTLSMTAVLAQGSFKSLAQDLSNNLNADADPFTNPLEARDDRGPDTNSPNTESNNHDAPPIDARDPLSFNPQQQQPNGPLSAAVNRCLTSKCDIATQPLKAFNACRASCLTQYSDAHKQFRAPVANSLDGRISKRSNEEMKAAVLECGGTCKKTQGSDVAVQTCIKSCVIGKIKPTQKREKREFDDKVVVEKRANSIDVKYIDKCYVGCYNNRVDKVSLYKCWVTCLDTGKMVLVY